MISRKLKSEKKSFFNFYLAFTLAWKSMRHHRLISFATILGVATGMCVVSTILIVDHNTARTDNLQEQLSETIASKHGNDEQKVIQLPIRKIEIIKKNDSQRLNSGFPSQQLSTPISQDTLSTPKGEEDYQAMRLAIRMASMFAFFIGSVIVFFTMRFSVAIRIREFALLLCLGEHHRNASLSLIIESFVLGAMGTCAGMLVAFPTARLLLKMGISTTGRMPLSVHSIPSYELIAMVFISLSIVLLGVISPIRTLYRFNIAQVLQPRFIQGGIDKQSFQYSGFSWLISPILFASYLAVRPFLENWLSVVYFFFLEATFIILLTLLTIWLTKPFLRFSIYLIEKVLSPFIPLETLLTVRRIRLTSHKFVFSITGVILVFSMLSSLHGITRSLKYEIEQWSSEAMVPYFFYKRKEFQHIDDKYIKYFEKQRDVHVFRLSAKSGGGFPIRLIHTEDYNRYRKKQGLPLFSKEQVIFSRTLAARFAVEVGDVLQIDTATERYNFTIIEINDSVGTFAENAQYVDIKSYALFGDGAPLFQNNLATTLGDFIVVRSKKDSWFVYNKYRYSLEPYYYYKKSGRELKYWQLNEIDKDFLIFDFILFMTVILAFIGIVNTLLIQVHSRSRELAVLKTLGVNRKQMLRLLLVEGLVIGLVGAVLSVLLGTALGIVSVSFLDHFTLFKYEYVWSTKTTLLISGFAVFTCCVSAIYPAIIATKISTAESLHYE